jgi:hypothetical protein
MKKHNKVTIRLAAFMAIFTMALLAGCTLSTPVNACHATGDPANPYQEITIDNTNLKEHLGHPNDIYPVPVGGCPTTAVVVDNAKITICHATDNAANPYNEIKVKLSGLNGHATHVGDIIPAPAGGCPTSPLVIVANTVKICHLTDSETEPYTEFTVNVNGLDGHVAHAGDIIPAPVGGCPTIPLVVTDGKVTICHVTSSKTNPYNEITVSVNGLNGHVTHEGDLIPAPETGCPDTLLAANEGKIMICHATGSEKNPYNLITVSINGLNGHSKHTDDIIPAPAGGCPVTKQ